MCNHYKKITASVLLSSHMLMSCYNPNLNTTKQALPPAGPPGTSTEQLQDRSLEPTTLTLTTADQRLVRFSYQDGLCQAQVGTYAPQGLTWSHNLLIVIEPGLLEALNETELNLATLNKLGQQLLHIGPHQEDAHQPGYVYVGRKSIFKNLSTTRKHEALRRQVASKAPSSFQLAFRNTTTSLKERSNLQSTQQANKDKRKQKPEKTAIEKHISTPTQSNQVIIAVSEEAPLSRPLSKKASQSIVRRLLLDKNQQAGFIRSDAYSLAHVHGSPPQLTQSINWPTYPHSILPKELTHGRTGHSSPIITRAGHQVSFIPYNQQWVALVKENCPPGFSRTLALPVLYPIYKNRLTLEQQIRHTVEALLTYSLTEQRQAVHVILPGKTTYQPGFVYTGPEMDLPGGGFWDSLGRAFGIALAVGVGAAIVGAAVVASGGALVIGLIGAGISTKVGVAAFSAFWVGVTFLAQAVWLSAERDEALSKVRRSVSGLEEKEREITKSIEKLIGEIDKDPVSYKKSTEYIEKLDEYKSKITAGIAKLNGYKHEYDESLKEEDKQDIDKHIKNRGSKLQYIENKLTVVKEKLRKQAWVVFKKESASWQQATQEETRNLDNELKSIACMQHGSSTVNAACQAKKQQLYKNIKGYENWEQEPALFPEDRASIDKMIKEEKEKLAEIKLIEKLVNFAKQDPRNAAIFQKMFKANTQKELSSHCQVAIKRGRLFIVNYLVSHKGLSPNTSNNLGNTLLHQAVLANQADIVAYLLKHGANKSATNKRGKSPLAIAKKNNNQEIIALLQEE